LLFSAVKKMMMTMMDRIYFSFSKKNFHFVPSFLSIGTK
jgi:hypothetical protein